MTTIGGNLAPAPQQAPETGGFGPYCSGVAAVLGMELRQRLRSRGWYVLLGIWVVVIAAITVLTWWSVTAAERDFGTPATGLGSIIFEVVLSFVLLLALLVAPAFSANAVNGDRAAGTLAIVQVTLLRPGQLLWGKFLASWVAGLAFLVASIPFLVFGILQGGLGVGRILISLLMLAVEVGIVCAIGVGISALAGKPLFSIVVTYLVVAALGIGTLIAFVLGASLSTGTVLANQQNWHDSAEYVPAPAAREPGYDCIGPLEPVHVNMTQRVAWMLAPNPFVVVADAIPGKTDEPRDSLGTFAAISKGVRQLQAGPEASTPCAGGHVNPTEFGDGPALWPLGLALQLVPAAVVLGLGWRALRTPAKKLARGTRVA